MDKNDDGSRNSVGGDDSDDCDEDVHIEGHNDYWRCFDALRWIQEPSQWTV